MGEWGTTPTKPFMVRNMQPPLEVLRSIASRRQRSRSPAAHADLAARRLAGGDLLSYVDSDETLRWLSAEDLLMAAVVSEARATVSADAPKVLTSSNAPHRFRYRVVVVGRSK
ncbi:MAG: hypothetical protein R3C56_03200 [Pirellulaceae bacterium]